MIIVKENETDLETAAEDIANGIEILFDLEPDEWGWDDVYKIVLEKLKEYPTTDRESLVSKWCC